MYSLKFRRAPCIQSIWIKPLIPILEAGVVWHPWLTGDWKLCPSRYRPQNQLMDETCIKMLSLCPRTNHSGVVVIGEHALTQSHKQPESLLLFGVEQQHRGDDIHGLPEGKGCHQTYSTKEAVC